MKYGFFCLCLLVAFSMPARAETSMGIAAVVNDEAISMTDVNDRMKLVLVSSGLPDGKDIRARIRPQVVDGLIEEQLKMQEAARKNLTIPDEAVEEGFATIAQQNNMSAAQFNDILKKQGVSRKTLDRQIRAQLVWNEYIKKNLRREVEVTKQDIDTRLERLKSKIGQTEYLVSEIFLPLDNPRRNKEVEQFASRMAAELQAKKAPFGAVAAQFSKAASADKGGAIGWVQQGQLEDTLDRVLSGLEEGQVSNPIRTPGGIYVLFVQKKRTFSEASIPSREDLTNTIGFERLDRVQQRILLNLKSSAFIDRRV